MTGRKSKGKSTRRKPAREHATSPNSAPVRDELSRKQKVLAIRKALNADPVDIASLRQLAISRGGLINDELRLRAWPKLLNVNVFNIGIKPSTEILQKHKDYHQVVLDVNRSLKRFPPGMHEEKRLVLQDQLVDVIMWVLVRHPQLHYYQGYHDICVTFLLVVGEDKSFALVDKLSTVHLRDFMDLSMDRTRHMLNYLYPIVGRASPRLRLFMERSEVGTIFCLSWLITWFGHVLNEFRHVVRLYDFFLACHPLMPIYLGAAIVLFREEEILQGECEMAYIHSLMSKIPQDLPFEHLITQAGDLFIQYPPTELASEAELVYKQSTAISTYSNFELSTYDQRPDKVLRTYTYTPEEFKEWDSEKKETHLMAKMTVWAIAAGLSAAAVAVANTAAQWWQ